jgi:hypothetical protein
MPHSLTWRDRARIERVVWALDQRLYDLPRASRIATRREVRQNLITAARDVGAGTALKQLGGTRELASEYLTAEYGEGPRHSWIAACLVLAGVPLVLIALLGEAALGFGHGITAAYPHATGTFAWDGVSLLQTRVTYTLVNGHGTYTGGAMSPLAWALLITATVTAGRLWRAVPTLRRRRAPRAAS